jgi:hypothetical protein
MRADPFGVCLQDQASNRFKLQWSNAIAASLFWQNLSVFLPSRLTIICNIQIFTLLGKTSYAQVLGLMENMTNLALSDFCEIKFDQDLSNFLNIGGIYVTVDQK